MEEHTKPPDQIIADLLHRIRTHALGMWRYRWSALAIVWITSVLGWLFVYTMPNTYEAQARVFVKTETAIKNLLGGIAESTDVMNEVNLVVREMLSRPNLAEVARNTDLSLRAKTQAEFENLLTFLQTQIKVAGGRDGIYSISFGDTNREKALDVVDTLLTAFVEKSLGADRTDSAQAQQFLQEQIREYDRRLTEAEDRLAKFKQENVEFMPDQQGDYFSRLQTAEADLRKVIDQLSLANEKRDELLRQIEGEEPVFGIMESSRRPGEAPVSGSKSAKIRELEMQLEQLRLQYTDKHPRIGQILDTLELLREEQRTEREQRRAESIQNPLQQNPLDLNPVYQNMRIQLSDIEVDIAALREERNQQQQEVNRLRRMVDTIPQVEADLKRLNRDYEVVLAKHQQLLQQLESANLGDEASKSMDDVQFRIIDPPFADLQPVGPNRPLFISAIFIAAIGLSGGIAFLRDQINPTFVGPRSVTDALGIPVLAAVSLVGTQRERRAEKRSLLSLQFAGIGLVLLFIAAAALSAPVSEFIRNLLMESGVI